MLVHSPHELHCSLFPKKDAERKIVVLAAAAPAEAERRCAHTQKIRIGDELCARRGALTSEAKCAERRERDSICRARRRRLQLFVCFPLRFICTGGTAHNNREQEVRARESSAASSTRNQFHPVRTLRKFAYKFPLVLQMHVPAAAAGAASGLQGFATAMFCFKVFSTTPFIQPKEKLLTAIYLIFHLPKFKFHLQLKCQRASSQKCR